MIKSTRIGRRMSDVLSFVAANPGCTMLAAAEAVGPHGSRRYGYASVHRAIDAGLVVRSAGARRGTFVLAVAA